MGDDTCCNEANKCDVGEGDCDFDEDCLEGLKCGSNNCQGPNFEWDDDCCEY